MTEAEFSAFREAVGGIPEVRDGLVTVSISPAVAGIEIDAIWSESQRRRGHAGRAMGSILDIADELGIDLRCQPHWMAYDTDGYASEEVFPPEEIERMERLNAQRLDNQQLLAWYERLGFERTGNTRGDDIDLIRRARAPRLAP